LGKSYDSVLKDLAAVHVYFETGGVGDLFGLAFAAWPAAARVFDIQLFRESSIRMEVSGEYAGFVIRTEDYRPRAITENYRGVPATRGEVQRGGLDFRTDHEDGLVHACFYELVGHRQGVDESGAGVADIQRGYAFEAEFPLKQYTGSRKEIVRGNGGEYNEVNLLCFDPCILHRHMGRFGRHVGHGVLRRVDEPAFMN